MFKETRMDTATQTLLYRSEAFAEDVLDLVCRRPVAVQAPTVLADSTALRRAVQNAAALLSQHALPRAPLGGSELPAV